MRNWCEYKEGRVVQCVLCHLSRVFCYMFIVMSEDVCILSTISVSLLYKSGNSRIWQKHVAQEVSWVLVTGRAATLGYMST